MGGKGSGSYKRSLETKKKMSERHKGQIPWNKGTTGLFSEEYKKKLSDAGRGKQAAEKHPNWKGGLVGYLHEKARQLFGRPLCEDCDISLEQYRRENKKQQFEMHCITKDFQILEQWNWKCVCHKCHRKIHKKGSDD